MRLARIEFPGAGEDAERVPPASLPAINEAGKIEDFGVVRQGGAGDGEFFQGRGVILVDPVITEPEREVGLGQVRRAEQSFLRQGAGSFFAERFAPDQIHQTVEHGGAGAGEGEFRIERDRLDIELVGLDRFLPRSRHPQKFVGLQIEQVGLRTVGRLRGDPRLFFRRQFRPQLLGDGLGDVALDGEDIGQVAVVGLGPKMGVGPGIDQLRVHPHFARDPLHAAFEEIGDAELPADLAQVARGAAAILHHARAADHFQVGDPGQVGQDFVLHAVGEDRRSLFLRSGFQRATPRCFFPE